MNTKRASKGLLVPPTDSPVPGAKAREEWLKKSFEEFVTTTPINRFYYLAILSKLWPEAHGIPGPHVSEETLRETIDAERAKEGKPVYRDPFRRVRELQGEEGFISIVKQGKLYQLNSLVVRSKRVPRAKLSNQAWNKIRALHDNRCAHCGQQEPSVKLSPDHKIPRSRNGNNDLENWQPLCEQCNIQKGSSCQNCQFNCWTCPWAFPDKYKPIQINDDNKELLRRQAIELNSTQSDLVNNILRRHFSKA